MQLHKQFKQKASYNTQMHIIHLDDQQLFQQGLKLVLQKAFDNVLLYQFKTNAEALVFLNQCLATNIKIDLIITDFNHPGPNGLYFAKAVKELTKQHKIIIPIMLLTMSWQHPQLVKATQQGIFDWYVPKSATEQDIVYLIKQRPFN
ncbi:MAG: hypothetical protein RL172_3174 [Bacteroidota bacterium]|jgi:DNA-binding NarL/FixJ family response regulator